MDGSLPTSSHANTVGRLKPEGTLYWGTVQTVPLARPHFTEMIQAFDLLRRVDYPARGEA